MPNSSPSADRRFCAACGSPLSDGANFCHRCGTPVGSATVPAGSPGAAATAAAPAERGALAVVPWAVAFVALLALAAMAAGRNFSAAGGSRLDAPSNALPQAALGEGGAPPAGAAAPGGPMGARGVDLASMSPQEQADRLFDRVMRLAAEGKVDSVQFFAPMALGVYGSVGPLSLDHRYDMGRIAEVAGAREVSRAQADTILRQSPTHLLGLILAAKAASMAGDSAAVRGFEARLVAAESAELARKLPEYERHGDDIRAALREVRARR